jgi:hypothetical protein
VPRALVRAVSDAAGLARVSDLVCAPGLVDPVMCDLGAAVLALFDRREASGSAVQQHLALAICAHLVHRFGCNAKTVTAAPLAVQHPPHALYLH